MGNVPVENDGLRHRFRLGVGRPRREDAEIKAFAAGGDSGLIRLDHQVVTAPLQVPKTASFLASSGQIVTSACSTADGVLSVRSGTGFHWNRQHLGLARGTDDGIGSVVDVECILLRQAHLVGGQAVVGQVELERLIALGGELECDRVDECPLVTRLVGRVSEKLGLGGDLGGAIVVDAAKELVDLGLVFVAPGLECQNRDVSDGFRARALPSGPRSPRAEANRREARARSRPPRARGCPG